MDYATYASAQNTARQIYDHKLAREGGPRFARVKELDRRAQGQVSNNYLHFENIRQAALGSPAEIDRDELLRIWSSPGGPKTTHNYGFNEGIFQGR